MKKVIYLIYGVFCYLVFLATFLYLIGFVENAVIYDLGLNLDQLFVTTINTGNVTMGILPAIVVNLLLISLFGLQHSVMARPSFKQQWTKIVPQPIERSTFVLFASLALLVMFYFWQPVTLTIWNVSHTLLGTVFLSLSLLGWVLLLISTYQINHFELFGLRQVYLYARGREDYAKEISFRKPLFYKYVRHPLYFSFLMVFWFTPHMTVGHLVFSLGMTTYIFVGIYHEEKDLIKLFGEKYIQYRAQVPKIIPFLNND